MKCILIEYIQSFSGSYDPDKLCVFPFKWRGVTYDRCTDFGRKSKVENEMKTIQFFLQHFDSYRISAPLK